MAWSDLAYAGAFDSRQAQPAGGMGDTLHDGLQIVFIDGSIAGAAALAAGVRPGLVAVILDPGQDGVRQIADYLASHDIEGAANISIVAHGADGVVEIGSTMLSTATIAQHLPQLAEIGAALRPGGDIQLYGCDVAQDASGQAFLQQLSQATGGTAIAASSHVIGAASAGGNWNLDVDVGAVEAAQPFTAQALSTFGGALPLLNNQLFVSFFATKGDSQTRLEQLGVSGSSLVGTPVDIQDGSQTSDFSQLQGVVVDAPRGKYFMVNSDFSTVNQIVAGSVTSGTPTVIYSPATATGSFEFGGLAIDQPNHTLYFIELSTNTANDGIYKIDESGASAGTATAVAIGQGVKSPLNLSLDLGHGLAFFTDNHGIGSNVNNLDVANLSTGTITVLNSQLSAISADIATAAGQLDGVAVDAANQLLYFTALNGKTLADNFIFRVHYTVSGAGAVTLDSLTTLYSGSGTGSNLGAGSPGVIAVDAADSVFYVGDRGTQSVDSGSVNGGSNVSPLYQLTTTVGVQPRGIYLLSTPTVTVSGNVAYNAGGSAAVLASGLTLANPDGQNLASATVAIAGGTAANGETLAATTTGTSITASYNSANETLTLSGNDTLAHYQSVLRSVTFSSTGATTGSRTIDWTVSDGIITSATPTSTVTVSDNLTFTATTGVDTFVAGAGNDTFIIPATNTVNAGDTFNGGVGGTDTIQIGTGGAGTNIDLSGAATDGVHGFLNIEDIAFTNTSGLSSATFSSAQFGPGLISSPATVTGSTATDFLNINMAANGSLDMSGWTFANWSGNDQVFITGSTGSETIKGGSESDTFIVDSTAEVGSGDTYDGGGGLNFLQIGNGGAGSIDLSGAAVDGVHGVLNIGVVEFSNPSGIQTATFNSAQFGTGKISSSVTFAGSGGTNALVINMATNGSLDTSGWGFANWTGANSITIAGVTGLNQTIKGSSQADTFIVTKDIAAGDTWDGGGGFNTIQIGAAGSGTPVHLDNPSASVLNFQGIAFANTSGTSAVFLNSSQFGAGKISNTLAVTGSTATNATDAITIKMATGGSLDLSGWTFANWTSADTLMVQGAGSGNTFTGSTVTDTILGGPGNDTFIVTNSNQVGAGDTFNGGGGNDIIQIGTAGAGTSIDLSGAASNGVKGFLNITGIAFANTSGTSTATFSSAQFGVHKISNTVAITGSAAANALVVDMAANGSLDMSAWTFANWTSSDTLVVQGASSGNTFTGSRVTDTIVGGSGNDTFIVTNTNQVLAGDTFDGGGGNNIIQIGAAGAGTSIDLSGAASDGVKGFLNIGGIAFANTSGTSTATLGSAQFGSGKISNALAVTAGTAADALVIDMAANGSLDLSGWTFTSWTSSDTIDLMFAAGVSTVVGSSQADTFVFTNTNQVVAGSKFDGGGGTNVIQVGNGGAGSSIDFSGASSDGVNGFLNIAGITFTNTSGTSTATFSSAQFGAGKISNSVTITGSAATDALIVNMTANGALDMSGWGFTNWTSGTDTITVTASTGIESIVGSSQADTFVFT
ncbi:MAG: DUF4347 domain-containing protein, partial [Alphaproteobacteria bacterium]|nr:DUF4347 domain-containing protein [Alphaproteobacteria bacterium]